jgi:hypothetical protein
MVGRFAEAARCIRSGHRAAAADRVQDDAAVDVLVARIVTACLHTVSPLARLHRPGPVAVWRAALRNLHPFTIDIPRLEQALDALAATVPRIRRGARVRLRAPLPVGRRMSGERERGEDDVFDALSREVEGLVLRLASGPLRD